MSDPYYPQLDPATVKALPILQQLSQDHKSYWLTAPYDGITQGILERILAPRKVIHEAKEIDIDPDENMDDFLATESRNLYQKLKTAGLGLAGSEELAYLKTSTALLEKLLAIQERANNLVKISEFYATVMDIMDSELSSDLRTRVMERLEAASKQ